MNLVFLAAFCVGGATMLGALLGFIFKKIPHRMEDIILSFAAGIMLSAAVFGLIGSALEDGGLYNTFVVIAGIFAGAAFLSVMDKAIPHLHSIAGADGERPQLGQEKLDKVLLFVFAVALHNLPEGIAAGVGFGTGQTADALSIAAGIALQNIPEGMVIIAPMLSLGVGRRRTLLIALSTGVIEIIGTFIGFFAATASAVILPFMLSFAGGTMIYVISDEMIPETHSHGFEKAATFSLIGGFCIMLILSALI